MLFIKTLTGSSFGVDISDLETWGQLMNRLESQHPQYAGVNYVLLGEGGKTLNNDPSQPLDKASLRYLAALTLVVRKGPRRAADAAAEQAYQRSALEGMLAAMEDERARLSRQMVDLEARMEEARRRLAQLE